MCSSALRPNLVGKFNVAPWLHARRNEQLGQRERQHQELLEAHQELIELHERHDRELFHRGGATGEPDGLTSPPPP
ncbi:MAG: hypothetical protein DLM58_03295 [Pseudonocardiales bacterium]|nr:MAG: hypothetical protein DLM58_03295 [Pseudonocardiales bacterium]